MKDLPKVQDADLEGKKVFLRLDLDVPFSEGGDIPDTTRLEAAIPTISFLTEKGAIVLMAGHRGRPTKVDKALTLFPVADWFSSRFKLEEPKTAYQNGLEAWELAPNLIVLENLRFSRKEEANDPDFAQKLADLADIYVNDAFGSSHRAHASIVGVPALLPHFAGLRLQQEIEELSKISEDPKRPFVVVVGGAKIETKLPLIEKMHQFADYVLVGGELAEKHKELMKVAHEKVVNRKSILIVADLNSERSDITPNSFSNFFQVIRIARMIVWNGPIGITAKSDAKILASEAGTKELANAIARSTARTIVGGGDTLAFLKKENLLDLFSFVSTGGGAMLEFLSGEKLPGLKALES